MANTFTLAGTSLDAQNNAAYAGQYMTLRVTSVGTDTEDAASYPEKPVSFLIDSNGDWTSGSDLWVNGDSGIESFYEMVEPSGQRIQFVFPSAVAGTTVRYEFALENYLVENAAAQLSPALAVHIADLNNPHVVTAAQTGAYTESEADTEFVNKTSEQSISGTKHFSNIDIATDLGLASGGTGASTASAARTNLGVEIGVDVEAFDATILKDADIGVNVEAFDATILKDADINVTVQAYDALLDSPPSNFGKATTSVTGTTYTTLATDKVILANNASGVTVTLIAAATAGDGLELTVKNVNALGVVTVDGNGTETIDGDLTQELTSQYDSFHMVCDGSNWNII